jgi:hypothetical protein
MLPPLSDTGSFRRAQSVELELQRLRNLSFYEVLEPVLEGEIQISGEILLDIDRDRDKSLISGPVDFRMTSHLPEILDQSREVLSDHPSAGYSVQTVIPGDHETTPAVVMNTAQDVAGITDHVHKDRVIHHAVDGGPAEEIPAAFRHPGARQMKCS